MAIVICPQCGHRAEVEPGQHPFCRQCDYPLFWAVPRQASNSAEPTAVTPAPSGGAWRCPACDMPNATVRTLCERCGETLQIVVRRRRRTWEQPEPPPLRPSPARQFATGLALGFTILLVGAVMVAAALYLWWWPRGEWQIHVLDSGEASWDISATIVRGLPVIAYVDALDGTLRVLACGDDSCDGSRVANSFTVVAALGDGGHGSGTSITVGRDGSPVIAFRSASDRSLYMAACGDLRCEDPAAISIQRVDPPPGSAEVVDIGPHPSIALAAGGFPIISYHDRQRGALKVAHCLDRTCSRAEIAVIDRGRADGLGVGAHSVIRVGPDGLPLIAYRDDDASALMLARCSDERCSQAATRVVAQDPGQRPGFENAMLITPRGELLLAYTDWSDDGIYVVRCADLDCAASSRQRVDRPEDGASAEPSIALDRSGLPLVSYRQRTPGDERGQRILRVVRCRDLACSDRRSPELVDDQGRVGYSSRMHVLANGRIVIAYGDATGGALKYAYRDH